MAAASAVIFFLSAMALSVGAAVVEHTFVVSQVKMVHLCKETLVTVVNRQLPGPAIEVIEGDSVAVHVVNQSPYNITIHWHGVRQWLNCWADGVPMLTQHPILPYHNYTYRFNVVGQEGTLWWHAHVAFLRATVHGALIIRPRQGARASLYPFPQPHREVPIIIGDWWELENLVQVEGKMEHNDFNFYASAATVNGKLGDLFNCSGVPEDGYVLDVEPGKTYLLRIINTVLYSELYIKIAGHKFTVVAADANYVNPFTTDVIAIAPGETVDALIVADAPPDRYYLVALPSQAPFPDTQTPEYTTRGVVQYSRGSEVVDVVPMKPKMPDVDDTVTSFDFHSNLTSSLHRRRQVPLRVDEHMFIVLGLGSICRSGYPSCNRGFNNETILVATMNNVSFQAPVETTPLLEAHYCHTGGMARMLELPNRPPRVYNFTDTALIPFGPKEMKLEATSKATVVRRFRHGAVVDMVFQGSAMLQGDSNPMHLHGHDMFVLAQGVGNYDEARDVARYNLINPPLKNTVLVPNLGWVAVRFVANNPGVWFMHCHYEFHLAMGMAAVFIVDNGPTENTSLPTPPMNVSPCGHDQNLLQEQGYLQTKKPEAMEFET